MITRGTTQTQCFKVPYDWSEISKCYISYQVQNKKVLEKKIEELYYSEEYGGICVDLTQEDTLNFPEVGIFNRPKDSLVLIQIRILTKDKVAYAGPIIRERLLDVIKKEDISDGTSNEEINIIIYDGGDAFGN